MRRFFPWIALVGAGLIVYASFEWAIGAVIHHRKVVMVPDVQGRSVLEALNLLALTHLGVAKEGDQFDKQFPAGTIVRQSPPPGMMVREGRIVKLTISQGGETLFVPDLLGQPLRNGQTMLQNAGLSIGEVEQRPSLRYEKDQVMAQDPPGGQMVSKNTLVNLIVSAGSPSGDMLLTPDFVGKNVQEAKRWADEHQVALTTREDNNIARSQGEVLQQAPTADAPIRAGDSLTVVVNASAGGGQGPRIHFEVPPGSSDRDVKIFVIDESGEREVFRRAQPPGSQIDLNVEARGRARARIFVNGILAEEQQIQ